MTMLVIAVGVWLTAMTAAHVSRDTRASARTSKTHAHVV
jgi:hypothetical protein